MLCLGSLRLRVTASVDNQKPSYSLSKVSEWQNLHPVGGGECKIWRTLLSKSCFSQEGGPLGFPGGAVVENLPANAGDTGSSPGLGGSHMPRSN